jgi:hypothetical protein
MPKKPIAKSASIRRIGDTFSFNITEDFNSSSLLKPPEQTASGLTALKIFRIKVQLAITAEQLLLFHVVQARHQLILKGTQRQECLNQSPLLVFQ